MLAPRLFLALYPVGARFTYPPLRRDPHASEEIAGLALLW